jgi:hypothetical protein
MRWSAALLLPTVGALFSFAPASAKDGDIPVRVDYRALAGCPAGPFLDRLLARSSHIRAAQANEPAPLVVVRVLRQGRGAHGHLVVHDVDGTEAQRNVEGDTCESVFSALVLMSAIALDPSLVAQAQGAETASSASADASAGAASTTGTPNATGATDASPTEPADGHSDVSTSLPSTNDAATDDVGSHGRETPIDRRPGLHLALGGGAGVESGAAPQALLTWGAYLEATRSESVLAPVARLAFEHANSGDQPASFGGVRFVRNLGVLDGCLRWAAGPVRLLPCVEVEGGALAASGQDVVPARSDTRPWVALGALARVRYVPISPLFLEIDGGLRLPLLRDRFFFEPDNTVFRAPAISAFGGGTLGFSIL